MPYYLINNTDTAGAGKIASAIANSDCSQIYFYFDTEDAYNVTLNLGGIAGTSNPANCDYYGTNIKVCKWLNGDMLDFKKAIPISSGISSIKYTIK